MSEARAHLSEFGGTRHAAVTGAPGSKTTEGEAARAARSPARCRQRVLIDFGSMGLLGLLPPPATLLVVLLRALEAADMCGVGP